MKYLLLLVGILAAFGLNQAAVEENKIQVAETAEGIVLSCKGDKPNKPSVVGNDKTEQDMMLPYHDDNTGEYQCDGDANSKIFVKFRTCDNCVELDGASIAGLAVGDVVATIVVGVAVYLIASQARTGQVRQTKKRSDKQNLIPMNERSNDSHYQPLRKGDKEKAYDVLNRK